MASIQHYMISVDTMKVRYYNYKSKSQCTELFQVLIQCINIEYPSLHWFHVTNIEYTNQYYAY